MTEQKQLELKAEKPAIKRAFVKFFLLIIVLGAIAFAGLKYNKFDFSKLFGKAEEKSEQPVLVDENPSVANPELPVEVVPQPAPLEQQEQPVEISPPQPEYPVNTGVEQRLTKLEEHNRYITIYFAAKELQSSTGNSSDFAASLDFLQNSAKGVVDLEGKLDLLKQASDGGISTVTDLKKDLDKLLEKIDSSQERSIWQNAKESFNGLVKVTKIKGKVPSSDYEAIIKRAQIALDSNDLKAAVAEVAELGKNGEAWVKKANNLLRVYEVTEFVLVHAKSKLISAEEVSTPVPVEGAI